MAAALEIVSPVTRGSLSDEAHRRIRLALQGMEGKRVQLTLKEIKRRRSNNQNAYYWGVAIPAITAMFREAGNYVDDEEVHEFLKLRVGKLSRVLVMPDGEIIKTLGSTAALTTMEFEAYVERVRAWAAEMGCPIPLPNEPAG